MTDDVEAKSRSSSRTWIKRMRIENPHHARNYCDHGTYIGHNGLFIGNCQDCNQESVGSESE
jgi:hypothetical protein